MRNDWQQMFLSQRCSVVALPSSPQAANSPHDPRQNQARQNSREGKVRLAVLSLATLSLVKWPSQGIEGESTCFSTNYPCLS